MKPTHHKSVRAALAGFLLAVAWPAGAQTLAAAKPAPIHGDSIDASPPPAAVSSPSNVVSQATSGVLDADFETLASYAFAVPDMSATNHPSVSQAEKQIPAAIKKLDGKTVRIRGFMMPVKELQGKTTEFMIMRGQPSCCFSGATEINEFVTVKAPGKGFDTMMDDAITIQGTLHVGAIVDSGFIVGLYQMDGEKIITSGH